MKNEKEEDDSMLDILPRIQVRSLGKSTDRISSLLIIEYIL
jgi:hypothetical protein